MNEWNVTGSRSGALNDRNEGGCTQAVPECHQNCRCPMPIAKAVSRTPEHVNELIGVAADRRIEDP